jgi:hypothetical protein
MARPSVTVSERVAAALGAEVARVQLDERQRGAAAIGALESMVAELEARMMAAEVAQLRAEAAGLRAEVERLKAARPAEQAALRVVA